MAKGQGSHKASRSAVTGKFVSDKYAKSHPKTTVRETVKNPTRKKK